MLKILKFTFSLILKLFFASLVHYMFRASKIPVEICCPPCNFFINKWNICHSICVIYYVSFCLNIRLLCGETMEKYSVKRTFVIFTWIKLSPRFSKYDISVLQVLSYHATASNKEVEALLVSLLQRWTLSTNRRFCVSLQKVHVYSWVFSLQISALMHLFRTHLKIW